MNMKRPCKKKDGTLPCSPGPHAMICIYCERDIKPDEYCPPHDWSQDGEKCAKCGTKDWMT